MATISLSRAWDDTVALVRREAGLLVPVALALIVLPGVLIDQLLPAAATTPAMMPTRFEPSMLAQPLSLLFTLFASLALSLLALRPGISVREAIGGALRRFGVAVGASLLLGLSFALLLVPAMPVLLDGQAGVQRLGSVLSFLLLLYLTVALIGMAYALIRLLLLNTVAAAERGGVFATLVRSWELTRGLFWRLLGFFLMFVAASLVASVAVVVAGGSVALGIGKVAGDPALGKLLFDLLRGIANAAFVTWLYLMLANVYRQLEVVSAPTGSNRGI